MFYTASKSFMKWSCNVSKKKNKNESLPLKAHEYMQEKQMINLIKKYNETILVPETSSLVYLYLLGHWGKWISKHSEGEIDLKMVTRNFLTHK